MADFRIHEPGVRLDRAEELVEIIQEFLIFVEVLKLGQLVQMRKPQGLTGEVGGVVAESGLLHLDALLMAQRAAGVLVEFWGVAGNTIVAMICSRTCRKAAECGSLSGESWPISGAEMVARERFCLSAVRNSCGRSAGGQGPSGL